MADQKPTETSEDSRKLRVLHLSDLHAKAGSGQDQAGQKRIVEALLDDVGTHAAERPLDLVVFSGDLSFDGSPEAIAQGVDLLLDAVKKQFPGVPIVITPGNHDVSRNLIEPVEDAGLATYLDDRDKLTARLSDGDHAQQARERLKHWDEFAATWETGLEPTLVPPFGRAYRLETNGLKVAIGVFDSAWRAQGGDEDRGKLILGADSLQSFISQTEDADVTVVTFHHPPDWLAPFDSEPVRAALEGGKCLVLTGHDHVPDPTLVVTTRGGALYCKAPCSYEDAQYSNGYAIIDVDLPAGTTLVNLRKWTPRRECFVPDVDSATDGQQEFRWPDESGLPALRLSAPTAIEPLVVLAHEHSVLGDRFDGEASDSVGDYAVAPRLWPVPHKDVVDRTTDKKAKPQEADPIALLAKHNVVTISGPRMSGVTTSLLWILEQHFVQKGTHAPAYVSADSRFSLGKITAELKAARDQTKGAPIILAIDDVAPHDKKAVARLLRLVKENPDVVFLLGCHDEADESVARALEERLSISPGRLFLGPFGRREARALVARILGTESAELVQKVLSVIQRQRLPRNPLNLAALVFVIVREPDLTAVNESGLLQQYVGVLLDNPIGTDPEGLRMDYRRREHLLEAIAREIVRRDSTRIPRLEIEQLVINYFGSIGQQSASAGKQVDSLIGRRVLSEDASGVGFRYPALLQLFTAKAALDDPDFAASIFASPDRYGSVIRHIAGLRRNDAETLKKVAAEAARVLAKIGDGVTASQFKMITDEDGWSQIRDLDHARALVKERPEPPTEEELDEIFDEAIEAPDEMTSESQPFPPEDVDGALDELMQAIGLAANVLQSSELVDDIELRRKVLQEVIEGWSVMTVLMAVKEDMFSSLSQVLVAAMPDGEDVEKHVSKIEYLVRLLIINVMTVGLYVEAGSIHQGQMLDELLDDEEFVAEPAHGLLATMLYAMLNLPKRVPRLRQLAEMHGSHPMVFEILRRWATPEYQSGRLAAPEEKEFEDFLVDLVSSRVEAGSAAGRAQYAASVRESLKASRVRSQWAEAEAGEIIELDGGP